MKKLTKLLMIAIIAILASCAKDGATGPQGPAGTNGNANVSAYLWNNPPASSTSSAPFIHTLALSAVDSNVLSKGAVLVYVENNKNTNSWLSIPFNNDGVWYYVKLSAGSIEIKVSFNFVASSRVRVVVIGGGPGGVTTVNRTRAWSSLTEIEKANTLYPNVDFNNYDDVKKHFNLKD